MRLTPRQERAVLAARDIYDRGWRNESDLEEIVLAALKAHEHVNIVEAADDVVVAKEYITRMTKVTL